MVMETPSPQCVGREFVRQYYTLLHEAPLHLHRFYSHNSSFVHGGVEKPGEEQPPIMGQGEIHKKIMSLNFRDCHAKIRQVDSQATVGSAVVVQVTGELSNNGQPMRRFMQTFVLAPQSPKKYYVHNDIFRYQDEVFHDDELVEPEPQEELEEYPDSEPEPVEVVQMAHVEQNIQDPPVSSYFNEQPPPPMSNGTGHLEEQPESPEEQLPEPEPQVEEEPIPEPAPQVIKQDIEPEVEPVPEQPTKPFSWAALASKNTPGSTQQVSAPPLQPAKPAIKPADMRNDTGPGGPPGGLPQRQRGAPPGRDNRGRPRDREGSESGDMDGGRRMGGGGGGGGGGARYPDNQQLFVGNLPITITEQQLQKHFEGFGKVVELRINRKTGGDKGFGFVVFEESAPVQRILSEKPIMFQGHRLNVEEKKQRGEGGRPGSGTRSGRGGSLGPRGPGGPGARGGGRGGMGGPGGRMDNRGGGQGMRGGGFQGGPRR